MVLKIGKGVVVEAPASSANVGPGFDVFAIAVEFPKDTVKISLKEEGGVRVFVEGIDSEKIPNVVDGNTAGVVAKKLVKDYNLPDNIEIRIVKGVPVGMGLGSSAASAAAVAYGINELFSLNLDRNSLVRYAAEGEVASAGKPHADNVSASLLGGFTLIRSYDPIDVLRFDVPENLGMCIASPKISYGQKKTEQFRAVIPKLIELDKLVHNVGHASALVAAILTRDLKLFARSLNDAVVEPARSKLIPGYDSVKKAALRTGALGVTISGAGPSMIAFYDSNIVNGDNLGEEMCSAFSREGYEATYICTKPGNGCRIVKYLF
ncbi:MAG: homoserine kinase [Nitrososphaeria archaeon]|nr:homoserine kinase [Nitrososphaeria archaeon]